MFIVAGVISEITLAPASPKIRLPNSSPLKPTCRFSGGRAVACSNAEYEARMNHVFEVGHWQRISYCAPSASYS